MKRTLCNFLAIFLAPLLLMACSGPYPDAPTTAPEVEVTPDYLIGPGDTLSIFVWRNPELTTAVPVRPDGRVSIPLVEDMQAANKTPTQLARDLEAELAKYVQDPVITVVVSNFVGPYSEQVRIVGQATQPAAIPYREKMTLLDAVISVGGLTEFADGNRAVIVRTLGGEQQAYRVRLDDLLRDGDVSANVDLLPGDVIIVPEAWF